jgi:hypothetical protein
MDFRAATKNPYVLYVAVAVVALIVVGIVAWRGGRFRRRRRLQRHERRSRHKRKLFQKRQRALARRETREWLRDRDGAPTAAARSSRTPAARLTRTRRRMENNLEDHKTAKVKAPRLSGKGRGASARTRPVYDSDSDSSSYATRSARRTGVAGARRAQVPVSVPVRVSAVGGGTRTPTPTAHQALGVDHSPLRAVGRVRGSATVAEPVLSLPHLPPPEAPHPPLPTTLPVATPMPINATAVATVPAGPTPSPSSTLPHDSVQRRPRPPHAAPLTAASSSTKRPPRDEPPTSESNPESKSAAAPVAATRTRFALLTGINYRASDPGTRLKGCENDIRTWERKLLPVLAPTPASNIRILMDSTPPAGATRDRIVDELRQLMSRTADTVLFLYSGHGLRVTSRSEGIVPTDFKKSGFITDVLLHQLVYSTPIRNLRVFLFDCCHSGSMLDLEVHHRVRLGAVLTSGGGSSPFYSGIRDFVGPHSDAGAGIGGIETGATQTTEWKIDTVVRTQAGVVGGSVSGSRSWGVRPMVSKVICISACREDQVDADQFVGEKSCGALTEAFETVLRRYNNKLTYRQLLIGLHERFIALRLDQIPQMETSSDINLDDLVEW